MDNFGTATASASMELSGLENRYAEMKAAEIDRHKFVENLLSCIKNLSREKELIMEESRAKERLAKTYQLDYEKTEKDLNSLRKVLEIGNFVLVLIDGDNTLFKDEYIQDGLHGGERAARYLRELLRKRIKDEQYFQNIHQVHVKIYLNLSGLAKTYIDAGILSNSSAFLRFVQGFNKTDASMEFIDAGNGKEAADNKIRAQIDVFHHNQHCKQIILAGSGDNSYAGPLRHFVSSSARCKSITLIEALPFASELQQLSDSFNVIRFDDIFRLEKIQTPSAVAVPPKAQATVPTAPLVQKLPTAPNITYASKILGTEVSNRGGSLPKSSQDNASAQGLPSISKDSGAVWVNSSGQRFDPPVKDLDKDLVYNLKQRKLCNQYFLGGRCSYGDLCSHSHKQKLTTKELENLKQVARQKPCDYGTGCMDPTCYHGHRCPYGQNCKNRATCWFSDEMHYVDLRSVKLMSVPY